MDWPMNTHPSTIEEAVSMLRSNAGTHPDSARSIEALDILVSQKGVAVLGQMAIHELAHNRAGRQVGERLKKTSARELDRIFTKENPFAIQEDLASRPELKKLGMRRTPGKPGKAPFITRAIQAGEGWFEVFDLFLPSLIRSSSTSRTPDYRGRTPFHHAASLAQVDNRFAIALINAGENPNLPDDDGQTPFQTLLRHPDLACLRALEDHPIAPDWKATDKAGVRAIDLISPQGPHAEIWARPEFRATLFYLGAFRATTKDTP